MGDFEVIIYQKNDGIGYVTVNRPQALNAYNLQMRDELYQVLGLFGTTLRLRLSYFRVPGKEPFVPVPT